MLLLKLILLFGAGILNILAGFIVLAKNPRNVKHIYFAMLCFALAGWVLGIAGFMITDSKEGAIAWAKFYYLCPLIISASVVLFSRVFKQGVLRKGLPELLVIAGAISLAVPLLFHNNFFVQDVMYHDWGKEVIFNKSSYIVYAAYLVSCFAYALSYVFWVSTKAAHELRSQAKLFVYGFTITSTLGVLFNLILPFFGNYQLIWLGPLFTNAFVLAIALSIVRHKMFDIRLVLARSIAYVLLLATLIAVYATTVYGLAGGLYADSWFVKQVAPLASALVVVLTSPYLKRLFDRVTNSIFYRDSYDPQEFLDRLNKTIITNIELGILLRRAASVIEEYMKSDYAVFGIYSNQDMTYRVVGTEPKAYTSADLQTISEGFEGVQTRVVTTDTLHNSQAAMHKILSRNDISVAVRLSSVLDTDNHTTGYLFLGHKKSGNTYNKQDLRMVEIVADELVIAIQNSLRFEEIQQFNVTLQNRINQATTKVKKSNEKLQALDQTKDDFISMASHQLRTPLTSMKGYISMVLEEDVGPINDNQRRMLQQAFISSQRMTYLISDLLNLSRLKTGKFVMDTGPVDLAQLVAQEVDQLKESAHNRELTLAFDPPKEFPELELDETKIRQVVMNFLDNAIYYTPSGGHITVELTEKAKNIEFTVHDTGIGVPKTQQHHLFSKFYRAPNAKQARPDGTGLGLYMAKKVVVGQGGAVIFRSSEGKGSTFGFTFPKHNRVTAAKVDDSDD